MHNIVSSYVKVMQQRQKLSFRLHKIILRDNVEGLAKSGKGKKRHA